jgi:hypothetical protein
VGRPPLIVRPLPMVRLVYLGIWRELTERQRGFLRSAEEWTDKTNGETCGVLARGPSLRVAKRLALKGLVQHVDFGADEEDGRELPAYAVTQKGRDVLRVAREDADG